MKSIIFLEVDDVLRIYKNAINLFGGSYGIHDLGLLESAIAQTQITFK